MADLSLGVIEIFTTCLRGYTIVTSALDVPEEQQSLYRRIWTQRARLTVWGEYWGIDPHSAGSEARHSRYNAAEKLQAHIKGGIKTGPDILDVLYGIAEVFVNGRRLQDTYGLHKVREAADTMELLDPDVSNIAIHGISNLPMSKARLDKNRQAIHYLGRCDWCIRDPSRFESLISALRNYNDDLYSLAPPQAREMMERALLSQMLAGRRDIRELLHIHTAAADDAEDMSPPSKGFFAHSYRTLSQAAKLRARANIDPFLKRRLLRPPTVLHRDDFQLHTSAAWAGGDACLAVTHSERRVVLVEFKSYVIDGYVYRRLEKVVHKLAEMLCADDKPPEFRLLPCSGYFHDPDEGRYGFVYELPQYLHFRHRDEVRSLSLRKPYSLKSLLRLMPDPIDLGTRLTLAKQLAATVYTIHACGSMHKNIRPTSILFLPAESGDHGGGPSKSRRVTLGKPYLMGWGFTRPDDIEHEPDHERRMVVPRDRDVGIYQHPERLRHPHRPYKFSYDVYSLGLVLLEVGLWQSVESFIGGISDFTTEEFREYLRKRVVPDLRGQCGMIYEGVVQQCLSVRTDEDAEELVEKMLVWDTLSRLWTCNA